MHSSTARQRRAGQYHKDAGGSDWEAFETDAERMPCRVKADTRSDNLNFWTQAISESELQMKQERELDTT